MKTPAEWLEHRRKQKRKSARKKRRNEKQSFEDMQTDYEDLRHHNEQLKEQLSQLRTWQFCAEFYIDILQQFAHPAPPVHDTTPPPPQPPPLLEPQPSSSSSSSLSSSSLSLSPGEASIIQLLIGDEVEESPGLLEMLFDPDVTLGSLKGPESLHMEQQEVTKEAAMIPEAATGSVTSASGTSGTQAFFSSNSCFEELSVSLSQGIPETVITLPVSHTGLMLNNLDVNDAEFISATGQQVAMKEAAMIPEVATGSALPVSGTPPNHSRFSSKNHFDDLSASSSLDMTGKMSSHHIPLEDRVEDKNSLLESLIQTYLRGPGGESPDSSLFGDYTWLQEDVCQRAPIPDYTADTLEESAVLAVAGL